jgi:DNA-binding response OmpR family regulator
MSKTVLLVEDDEILLKMYLHKFSSQGFIVKMATDGRKAMAAVADPLGAPDIVLLDVMIPEQDGFEVLRKIKADPKTKNIPVILLTDFGGSDFDRKRGLDLGATDYLLKSEVTPTEIVAKVKAILKE